MTKHEAHSIDQLLNFVLNSSRDIISASTLAQNLNTNEPSVRLFVEILWHKYGRESINLISSKDGDAYMFNLNKVSIKELLASGGFTSQILEKEKAARLESTHKQLSIELTQLQKEEILASRKDSRNAKRWSYIAIGIASATLLWEIIKTLILEKQ